MSQLPLVAFLEKYQLAALAQPLLALGVDQVDDLQHLDEDDLEELRSNLKKVQLKKFQIALESVKAPPMDQPEEQKKNLTSSSNQNKKTAPSLSLSRKLLIERMELEDAMSRACPRLLILVMVTFLLSMSMFTVDVYGRSTINTLMVHTFELEKLGEVSTPEDVFSFINTFAEASSAFYPVNTAFIPDPERVKITTGLKKLNAERPLPADLRPRLRTTFSLTAWMKSPTETWVLRAVPRRLQSQSPLEVCWGWRFPSKLVYGFHDLSINQPSKRMEPLQAPPGRPSWSVTGSMTFETCAQCALDC